MKMIEKITIRPQNISDAKRFYEILNNKNFKYFPVRPKSIAAERKFIKAQKKKRKNNYAYDYSILLNGKLVGAVGIKINQQRKFIGEIGYFIDEKYWGKGITTKAVKSLEKIAFKKLKIRRIEIIMYPMNKASEKVAIKCGYKKEGLMKKAVAHFNTYRDVFLYAKVK